MFYLVFFLFLLVFLNGESNSLLSVKKRKQVVINSQYQTAKHPIPNNRDDYVIFVLVHGVVNIPMKCGIISVYFRTFAVYYSILT